MASAPLSRCGAARRRGRPARAFQEDDPLTWRSRSLAPSKDEEADQQLEASQLEQLLLGASLPASPDEETVASPQSASEAIERAALSLSESDPEAAESLLSGAFSLPGAGPTRVRGRPAELSEGELQAAHYNLACARAALGKPNDALYSLEQAVEQGFDDPSQLESDSDLEPLKQLERFQLLVSSLKQRRKNSLPFGLGRFFG